MTKLLNLNGHPTLQALQVPAGQLYNYHIEIESGKHTIWNLLLKKQITEFRNANGLVLSGILREAKEIEKEFLEFENGKIKMVDNKPVLLEGKTEEEMNKKWNELMNRPVKMIV